MTDSKVLESAFADDAQDDRVSIAQIRESVRDSERLKTWPLLPRPVVLALVEAVQAAQRLDDHIMLNGGCHRDCPEHDEFRVPLARFDFSGLTSARPTLEASQNTPISPVADTETNQ